MFTGIVTEIGTVIDVEPTASGRRLRVSAPRSTPGMRPGDSVAVNGVCLTATSAGAGSITVEAVGETLGRSNLGGLAAGSRVDLERPMAGDGRFDGHIVQGHVDGTGRISAVEHEGEAWRVRIELPEALARYVVEKGSIAVDGVSLTVTACAPLGEGVAWFEVVLIPHTLQATVLGERRPGDIVNLEIDVIAKYVDRMMEARR